MKKMKRSYITALALISIFTSCNDNELFEKEMYKNEVSLVSSNTYNVFQEVVQMTGEEIIGYVTASVGGTIAPQQDIVIQLEEDPEPLAKYNWSNFDAAEDLYARAVPADQYDIAEGKLVIKAGQRTGRAMIKLRPEGLSPDSTYFIGLKAVDVSGASLNAKKSTVLYQVSFQNNYASQVKNSLYMMSGTKDIVIPVAANKTLFPLTYNSVRMVAGNEIFQPNIEDIDKKSIIVEVDGANKVTIKPYKDILINQLGNDPKYPNIFQVEESFGKRTNVFLLSYQYSIDGGFTYYTMKERVEMQLAN